MIEIKLLSNRRFIYSNRKQNIVITAENKATEIKVSFPEEYENYSKRVDFINSRGRPWTESLYTPEYEEYPAGYNKSLFTFTLPSEVTKIGELRMQFLAYMPDDSLVTVPFEIIPIQIDEGITAFKKGDKGNPDLLILSYNQSTEALFNSQQAKAKVEDIQEQVGEIEQEVEESNTTAASASTLASSAFTLAEEAKVEAIAAVSNSETAIENSLNALSEAESANTNSAAATALANQALQASNEALDETQEAKDEAQSASNTASLAAS
ncbi:MAG: hypothetical protein ACOX24_00395 [Christensenellales bacterium]|jgi:hypothetical protein